MAENLKTLTLSEDAIKFILAVLNDLPTKTGAFPLVKDIEYQLVEKNDGETA